MSNAIKVRKTQIIGTRCFVYSAWEPSSLFGEHTTIMSASDFEKGAKGWYGRVGTLCELPAEVEKMRGGSPERCAAVDAIYAADYERAYAAIVAAYPEVAEGKRSMGEIEIWK